MKKLKILIALTLTLTFLTPAIPSGAVCGNYEGKLVPYYEYGEQMGVQCVIGGNSCNCIGKIYWY